MEHNIKLCNKCKKEGTHWKDRCNNCHNEYVKKWRTSSSKEDRIRFCNKCKEEKLHRFKLRYCNDCYDKQQCLLLDLKKQKIILKSTQKPKERKKQNPTVYRTLVYKTKYGITIDDYNKMLSAQHNCCAICKTISPGRGNVHFQVDHCHITGLVRGLLCVRCNLGLGYFADSRDSLTEAILYLNKHSK